MDMFFKIFLVFAVLFTGCGYSTQSYRYKENRIRISPVVNSIRVSSEERQHASHGAYPALIEDRLTSRLVSEFNIRSNLEVVSRIEGALRLDCEVIDYRRQTLRYTDSDDPREQRLRLHVKMELTDSQGELLKERVVVGQTTFYLDGPQSRSERAAQHDLVEDTARRITEAVVEAW